MTYFGEDPTWDPQNRDGRRCHRRLELRTGMRLTTIKRVQAAQDIFSRFDRKYSNCDIQNGDHVPRPEVKDLPRGFVRYEIIGNCYVHGYMNGEMAASGDRQGIQLFRGANSACPDRMKGSLDTRFQKWTKGPFQL